MENIKASPCSRGNGLPQFISTSLQSRQAEQGYFSETGSCNGCGWKLSVKPSYQDYISRPSNAVPPLPQLPSRRRRPLVHAIGLLPWSLRAAAVMQCNVLGSVVCGWPSPLQQDLESRVSMPCIYSAIIQHAARMCNR